jgi:hypothetical protein
VWKDVDCQTQITTDTRFNGDLVDCLDSITVFIDLGTDTQTTWGYVFKVHVDGNYQVEC